MISVNVTTFTLSSVLLDYELQEHILSMQCKRFYTSPLLPSAVQGELSYDFFCVLCIYS